MRKVRFEGETLDEAMIKASEEAKVSISALKYRVVQYPSKGVFGLFKKRAIIEVELPELPTSPKKMEKREELKKDSPLSPSSSYRKPSPFTSPTSPTHSPFSTSTSPISTPTPEEKKGVSTSTSPAPSISTSSRFPSPPPSPTPPPSSNLSIENSILEEIEREVRKLIEVSCFDVEVKEVSFDPDGRVFIRIDGPDNSLLIGREGYRYASLNTLLFVWLHQKYRLKLRLEVGDFLQNQTEMVKKLIAPTIEEVKESGSGRTPPLKGFLPYLAQELLRKEFPRMYVKVKELNGEKFVIVRPFYGHNSSYWNA